MKFSYGCLLLSVLPLQLYATGLVQNDVTQINPIMVDRVITPTQESEIISAVQQQSGTISIGGGRFSMGGQTRTEGALFIDMKHYNKILDLNLTGKTITVQAGITRHDIQETIDSHNLSVMIMQTYSNFTVGGSLSVNVHGRYIGQGPIIYSVASLKIISASGEVIQASPTQNTGWFYNAIGGYGGVGVISEVTLNLVDNINVKRHSEVIGTSDYLSYFKANIRNNPKAIFHNCDLLPPAFEACRATTWFQTDEQSNTETRLIPKEVDYRKERLIMKIIADRPGGKLLRPYLIDPLLFWGNPVHSRNYEASYSVMELEPVSRKDSTYVLQEYFIPYEKFDAFVPLMKKVFDTYDANIINVSVRHAKQDPGSSLAWAKTEVFSFVVYYKQDTHFAARDHVAQRTRALIDEVISLSGSYYLPYQIHATPEQFQKAYPGFSRFKQFKQGVDPSNKFRNKLRDAYYTTGIVLSGLQTKPTTNIYSGYLLRPANQSYLTYPEWYIVFVSDDYSHRIADGKSPSDFPYFRSIYDFWSSYKAMNSILSYYDKNPGYHAMIWTIGISQTVEFVIKGLYENTIGRVTEWISGYDTQEDQYNQKIAEEYVRFIKIDPWYKYPFFPALHSFRSEPLPTTLRGIERKIVLTFNYLVKGCYAKLMRRGANQAYAPERLTTVIAIISGNDTKVQEIARYQQFTDDIQKIIEHGSQIESVEGNKYILLSVIANTGTIMVPDCQNIASYPSLYTGSMRNILECKNKSLHRSLPYISSLGYTIEHIFDY